MRSEFPLFDLPSTADTIRSMTLIVAIAIIEANHGT